MGLTSQPAGTAGYGRGIAPLHRTSQGAEHPIAAIHHQTLVLTLLVVYPQPQLPVMLSAAVDLITTDGPNADAGGAEGRRR